MKRNNFFKLLMLLSILSLGTGWAQYKGTGGFEEVTSLADLTDGYYVIVEQNKEYAMSNFLTRGYLGRAEISLLPSGKMANPSANIVWKIETNSGGKTIYNENSSKYLSYTGSRNNVQVVDNVGSNNQRWNFSYASNLFKVSNKAVANRVLQYNASSPRFACYKSNLRKLVLYKKVSNTADPDIMLGKVSGNTNENGTTATFTVKLTSKPTSDVVVRITSANTREVVVNPDRLTFTSVNWNAEQTVTATGVDDTIVDGNQKVTIKISVDNSSSANEYHGKLATTKIINEDDETSPVSLKNGDFETWVSGKPKDWAKAESATQETNASNVKSGSNSVKVVANSTRDIAQIVNGVTPGHYYKVSLWYKVQMGNKVRIWSYWKNNSTNINNNDYDTRDAIRGPYNSYLKPNKKWTRYEAIIKAPSGANKFYFEVRTYKGTTAYWDNFEFSLVNTWTGNTSNDWATATNWSLNRVPQNNDDVLIPSELNRYPTVSSAITVKSVTVKSGATLIAKANITGKITYKRALTTKWHLVASPVSGETFEQLIGNHVFDTGKNQKIGIGSYNNNGTAGWSYQTETSVGNLKNGTGVAVKLKSERNISFIGSANVTTINKSIDKGTLNGYNLVGNPFTSYINSKILLNNSNGLNQKTIWLWNGTQYQTKILADDFYVAPAQGFFVEASGNGNLEFNKTNQSHQRISTFMRKNKTEIHLIAKKGKIESKSKLYYIEGATKGFDNGYDGTMFGATTYDFAVYTKLIENNNNRKFAVQSLPNNKYDNLVVPVGLIAKVNDEIELSAKTLNLPDNINVYLEDRDNGVFTNLSENSYKVKLNKNHNEVGRFYIHTKPYSLSINTGTEQILESVSIFKPKSNVLAFVGLKVEKATVTMYSMLGENVLSKSFNPKKEKTIKLPNLNSGVYIVKITSDLGTVSKKIVL